jgi:hypothetical protein
MIVSFRGKDAAFVADTSRNEVDFWLKFTFTKKNKAFNTGDYSLVKIRIRCSDKMSRKLASISYRKNGESFANQEIDEPFASIPPDSNFDIIANALCDKSQ